MNRNIWLKSDFEKPCPNCETGHLSYSTKQTNISETLESQIANEFHKNGIVHPTTTFLVTTHFKCKNCGFIVTAIFEKVEDVRYVDENGYQIDIWNPVVYHPALKIIPMPKNAPKEIESMITGSFGLFWYDINSCGNKIRAALELLMDHVGIPKTDGKGKSMTLHHRLREYAVQNSAKPEIGQYLEAIKWIGNAASHGGSVKKNDILDAYELLEAIMEHVFSERKNKLIAISNRINSTKGRSI
ncbi:MULTISPECIES: DUF4145 domain-containing protein [Sphingobacterium]|uniref:DUF4145 domain-containing protein n=1 Tax=Sphingobacterium TaxID=28453 RepID=UPI0028AA179C|nr:DUF4145 domain-containing protein [Sphingobacterium multivorum]